MAEQMSTDLAGGTAVIHQSPHVIFGVGQRAALHEILPALGHHVLVCTDARMAAAPVFEELLPRAGDGMRVSVFSEVEPELPSGQVAALQRAIDTESVDAVVGIGGGSCMDMSKIAAAVITHGGVARDYVGEDAVPGPVKPIVTVPSTAGTGAEVTGIAVMTDEQNHTKFGAASRLLQPHTAVVDPELSLSCPPALTAHSGADALSHLIEAFTAVSFGGDGERQRSVFYAGKSALTDTHCRVGLKLVEQHLERAVSEPNDIVARAGMTFAALNAGMAINTAGTAGLHAIQGPVGSASKTPHGVGIGVLLRYVIRFTMPVRRSAFEEMAELWELAGGTDRAVRAIERIDEILDAVGIPSTIAELGITDEQIPELAAAAMGAGRLIHNSPRPMTQEVIEELLSRAMSGDRTVWS